MPAKVRKSGKIFFVVDGNTGKKLLTSGRFKTRTAAGRQARAINANTGGGKRG